MKKSAKSILQSEKECFFCRALWENGDELPTQYTWPLDKHHIMHGTANRQIADRLGLWVWLCPYHHTVSAESVHKSRATDTALIRIGQRAFEERFGRVNWMKYFGKNYL